MFGNKKKIRTSKRFHFYNGIKIPVRIYIEYRSNIRISFGQHNVLLRIPIGIRERAFEKHIQWAGDWIDQQLIKNPSLITRFKMKEYKSGDQIQINGDLYILNVSYENRKTITARAEGQHISLKIPADLDLAGNSVKIKHTLSRLFAAIYQEQVAYRISQLNDMYFQEHIQSIRIKYNKSNWGSCSAKRNINISSRLLFAPKEVQDYVFVHELTHLKELNHSPRFWRIVADIIPDYKMNERWLKEQGHLCDF